MPISPDTKSLIGHRCKEIDDLVKSGAPLEKALDVLLLPDWYCVEYAGSSADAAFLYPILLCLMAELEYEYEFIKFENTLSRGLLRGLISRSDVTTDNCIYTLTNISSVFVGSSSCRYILELALHIAYALNTNASMFGTVNGIPWMLPKGISELQMKNVQTIVQLAKAFADLSIDGSEILYTPVNNISGGCIKTIEGIFNFINDLDEIVQTALDREEMVPFGVYYIMNMMIQVYALTLPTLTQNA